MLPCARLAGGGRGTDGALGQLAAWTSIQQAGALQPLAAGRSLPTVAASVPWAFFAL